MLNTVIFDLDGTLLDTLGDLAASVNYALRTHQLKERSLDEVRQFLGNGIRYLMEHAVDGAVKGDAFERVFTTFRTHYVEHCLETTQPYPGIMPLLEELNVGMSKWLLFRTNYIPQCKSWPNAFLKVTLPRP